MPAPSVPSCPLLLNALHPQGGSGTHPRPCPALQETRGSSLHLERGPLCWAGRNRAPDPLGPPGSHAPTPRPRPLCPGHRRPWPEAWAREEATWKPQLLRGGCPGDAPCGSSAGTWPGPVFSVGICRSEKPKSPAWGSQVQEASDGDLGDDGLGWLGPAPLALPPAPCPSGPGLSFQPLAAAMETTPSRPGGSPEPSPQAAHPAGSGKGGEPGVPSPSSSLDALLAPWAQGMAHVDLRKRLWAEVGSWPEGGQVEELAGTRREG